MKYLVKNINNYSNEFYTKYFNCLNNYQKRKINKLKRLEDKKLSLLGLIIISNELKIDIKEIHYHKGAPYINQDIYFSITHKYPYVGVAISNHPIGIDIEILREIDTATLKYLENTNSLEALINWTRKESLFKCGKSTINKFKTILINKEIILTICN